MPGGNGLDLIEALLEIDPATKIVVLTGYGSIATALEAVRRGAIHYLSKPADADAIVEAFSAPRDGGSFSARYTTPNTLARTRGVGNIFNVC